jgi:hypothetical protein
LRFEPWEEVFHASVAGASAAVRERFPRASLDAWWRDARINFDSHPGAAGRASLEVDVIPFSEEDEADARRWYVGSLRRGESPQQPPTMLEALTLSSIKRRGVVHFSWTAAVELRQ